MRFKEGVRPRGMRPEIGLALQIAYHVYNKQNKELVITSLNDGNHGWGSLHYQGSAVDLRTRHLTTPEKRVILAEIKTGLGVDYDVILEKDHLHIEFQPKEK